MQFAVASCSADCQGEHCCVQVVADCSIHHTEISLVSDWCPNLSFYSLMQPVSAALEQAPLAHGLTYSPNDTYLAVINSDGDNMQVGRFPT